MKPLPKIEKYSKWDSKYVSEYKAIVYHVYYNWLNIQKNVEYRLYHEYNLLGVFTSPIENFLFEFQLPQEKQYRFINRNNSTSGELKLVNSSNTPPVQNVGLLTLMRSIKEVLPIALVAMLWVAAALATIGLYLLMKA